MRLSIDFRLARALSGGLPCLPSILHQQLCALPRWSLGHDAQNSLRRVDRGYHDSSRSRRLLSAPPLLKIPKRTAPTQLQGAVFPEVDSHLERKAQDSSKLWTHTCYDQKSPIALFEKLGTLQCITFAYDGMGRSYGLFACKYCEDSQNEMSWPFVTTMDAIATSGITVREITMDDTRRYGVVSIGRLESLAGSLSGFDAFVISSFRDQVIGWANVMNYIANDLDLTKIELKNLFDRRGSRVGIGERPRTAITLEGPQLGETMRFHAQDLVDGGWGPELQQAFVSYPFIGQ
ncbi:hypothetical protein CC78DRAFT_616363 [Lojkania enalia]|uniref:Uncharacterized protein n=1 Tax=Lojkania enalia TaxID=147567 RepID=A0A9P4KC72_9PLEO|nr:hypothetical protein CC78DRAFT_616363 [Didymosphaeria enalia]